MKISEKQLIILYDISRWFIENEFHGFGVPYSRKTVIDIINEIINQQSDELQEIS